MKITKEILDKAVELKNQGKTFKEVQEILNLKSIRGIRQQIKVKNIKIVNNNELNKGKSSKFKKYYSDSNYFKIIDTYAKAYILGFTYSDGSVYNRERFGYLISQQDKEILEFIKNEISPTSIISTTINKKGSKNRKPQSLLRINNVEIVFDLINIWGVVPNKTIFNKLVFPKINDKLIWEFLKGIFDGDGCINISKKNIVRIVICMTDLNFLKEVQSFLNKYNLNFSIYEKQGKTCKYYLLSSNNQK